MLYRALYWINQRYALTVFWIYLGVFVLAFGLIFVFPPAPLFLVFIGLAGLGAAALIARLLRALEHAAARYALSRGRCPMCNASWDSARQPPEGSGAAQECPRCGAIFESNGRRALESARDLTISDDE
jgi:hypothetical protein